MERGERKDREVFLLESGKKVKQKRRVERVKNVSRRDKSWASLEDGYFSLCSWHRTGCGMAASGSASERADGQRRFHRGGKRRKEKTELK